MFLKSLIPSTNDSKKFHTPAKNHPPQYPVLKMTTLLHKISFESKFSRYRQLSPVEFPLASFLTVPDENGSGSLHENFLVRFRAGPTF